MALRARLKRSPRLGSLPGVLPDRCVSAPKKLVTRTRVATLLALPAGAITEPVATDHKPELNEIFGCSYGSHPVPSLDFDEDDERGPNEYGCVTRRERGCVNVSFIPGTVLAQRQLGQAIVTGPMWCRGDPEVVWDLWFEASPWAKLDRDPQLK